MGGCPKCRAKITRFDRSCGRCGWKPGEKKAGRAPQAEPDRQCAAIAGGARCERQGLISADTRGQGPWYCRECYAPWEYDRKPRARDWRDEMIEERMRNGKAEEG